MTLILSMALLQFSGPAHAGKARIGRKLRRRYARRLDCKKAEVAITAEAMSPLRVNPVSYHTFSLDACGQQLVASGGIWMGTLLAWDDLTLRKRAPIEMNCPSEQIEIQAIDAKTRIVTGCDVQTTYIFTDENESGSWVANSIRN